jgi:hypothetical protein
VSLATERPLDSSHDSLECGGVSGVLQSV